MVAPVRTWALCHTRVAHAGALLDVGGGMDGGGAHCGFGSDGGEEGAPLVWP